MTLFKFKIARLGDIYSLWFKTPEGHIKSFEYLNSIKKGLVSEHGKFPLLFLKIEDLDSWSRLVSDKIDDSEVKDVSRDWFKIEV